MRSRLHFYITSFILIKLHASVLNVSHIEIAIDYMENFNGLKLNRAMVVYENKDCLMADIMTDEMWKGRFLQNSHIYISFHGASQNFSTIINQLEDTTSPTVVVLLGTECSLYLRNFVATFPNDLLKYHAWIIVLNTDFKGENSLYKKIVNEFTASTRKLDINIRSQIHA